MTPLHVCAFAYHFTGKERDQESGLDFFGARYYASSMGRFMSPDWSDGPDPAPYASLNDPQSLKLYSYGGNNPLSNVDDDGHVSCYGQSQTSIFSCISTFFHNLFGGGGGSGSSAGVGGASHGDVPSAPDYWPNDFGRQVSMELGRRAPGALGIINYQAQNAVDEIGAIGFGEGGGGAIDGLSLNRFSEAEIEIAVEGAAAPRGLTTTGRSALQSHAERVGGPFEGLQKRNPADLIRRIMRSPKNIDRGPKHIDIHGPNGAGGVRLLKATGKFVTFLSK